jgi:CheY-like chemotaxis protein
VEDQLLLATVTKQIFEKQGYSVEIASHPREALALLSGGRKTDLLITDIKLPQMNGFELADEAHRRDPDLRIIYVTGYTDNPQNMPQRLLGPILKKPAEPSELLALVAQVLAEP